ncbi:MAG: Mrp/NBP35 family ATP-binding protein [Fibromonadaceae bacterium]|jgi:ATP-binding protein involved in chromosome partitioning|nr:Mrp/NBP35 family ATP-binding protein [Fibromonadaceae bacterium]
MLSKVKRIIAIASGKGGVGKSTVTANLAMTAALAGKEVGILDADLYGPSMGIMFGIKEEAVIYEDNTMLPAFSHGVKVATLAQLFPAGKANAWRGPRVAALVKNLLDFVHWESLDLLFIDMPPGTGDIQLSIIQGCNLSGAIMVSTPQAVALADCIKGIDLFKETNIPIFGLIENMSGFICDCGKEHLIFGKSGARDFAEKSGIPFLGQVSIESSLMEGSDQGLPAVLANPNSATAETFNQIYYKLSTHLSR